ncbi:ribosomal subunit 39S-domain-containing protein [Macrophomina phaseolina]|uniref:Large ribosomal subunit protein mL50 n=1 Tax=Macrophomina phaseolina TaxID=35725 RepID=A0ABQ8GBT7_9PEZI|nr:ribosomal subunit 39S-domain-containing protein [Macrophomina phaseolina]
MRRIPRISRPIDRALDAGAAIPRSRCRACAFSTAAARADANAPLTERLRSKIWGTEYAPGREDPYSFDSPMRDPRQQSGPQRPSRKTTASGPTRPVRQVQQDGYEPAKTWHGLEWVGGKQWADEQEQVPPFIPTQRLSGKREITAALRRALVEVFAARRDGVRLETLYDSVGDASVDIALRAAEDGSPLLETRIVDHQAASIGEAAEAVGISPEEVKAWRPISLRDPEVKFAVVKRVMQLTGIRIPDPVIADSATAGILLNKITVRPEPKKLADKLGHDQKFAKLPNVKISSRRITPIDKEKEVGRWKVIEQKLLDRNLPVTGHEI